MSKAKVFNFTQKYLQSRLHYNKTTGIFTWKQRPENAAWNAAWAGKSAGCLDKDGYIVITIDYIMCYAHRLAWFYVHGEQPAEVDHEDTVKDHNWLDNLRSATRRQNSHNQAAQTDNISGFKGVTRRGTKYIARINVAGQHHHLGTYATPEAASAAYIEAAKRYHKSFARWDAGPVPVASPNQRRFIRPMPPPMKRPSVPRLARIRLANGWF